MDGLADTLQARRGDHFEKVERAIRRRVGLRPAVAVIYVIDLMAGKINLNLVANQIRIWLSEDSAKYILEKTCNHRSVCARPLSGPEPPSTSSSSGWRRRFPERPTSKIPGAHKRPRTLRRSVPVGDVPASLIADPS